MWIPSSSSGNSCIINTSIFTSVGPTLNDDDRCISFFFLDHNWLQSDEEKDWNENYSSFFLLKACEKLLKRCFLFLTHSWKEVFSQQSAKRTGHWWKCTLFACLPVLTSEVISHMQSTVSSASLFSSVVFSRSISALLRCCTQLGLKKALFHMYH